MIKLAAAAPAGRHQLESGVREHSGCTIAAVERAGPVIMDILPTFVLDPEDALYVCGTTSAFDRFYQQFPE